ncbi:MAG: hypothetical protein WCJ81_07195 [bacterium]
MSLISAVQNLLIDITIPADELEDVVYDAQMYALEELIDQIVPHLSEQDIIALDDMIEEDKTVADIDTWLSTKIPEYDTYVQKILPEVKAYLLEDVLGEDMDTVAE